MANQPVPTAPPARTRVAPPPGVLPRPVIPQLTRLPNPVTKNVPRR